MIHYSDPLNNSACGINGICHHNTSRMEPGSLRRSCFQRQQCLSHPTKLVQRDSQGAAGLLGSQHPWLGWQCRAYKHGNREGWGEKELFSSLSQPKTRQSPGSANSSKLYPLPKILHRAALEARQRRCSDQLFSP